MSELRDLYQEVILDHSKRPRNFGPLAGNRDACGHNPLCGDQITVHVLLEDDRVQDIRFEGSGCAISTAAASMMTEAVKGRTREEIEQIFERYHHAVTGRPEPTACGQALGKLAAFSGVAEFPMRVKCATLSWHTLRAALEAQSEPVTTE